MAEAAWKRAERALAGRLDGRRTGPSGRSGPDIVADWLQVEVKTRRSLPAWLRRALAQARVGCPETRLPLVIVHQAGVRHADDVVLLRLCDFESWFGPLLRGAEDAAETGPEQHGGG